MKKTDCSVIRDLLPLYIDDVCGAESKVLVEEHLKLCRECTAEKVKMKGEIELPKDTGIKALMNIEIKISKKVKRVFVILGAILLGVVITVAAEIVLSSYQIPVDYEDLDGDFFISKKGETVNIGSHMNDSYWLNEAVEEIGVDEDGVRLIVVYVGYMTTPMTELRKGIEILLSRENYHYGQSDRLWSSDDGKTNEGKPLVRVTAIYYLPLEEEGVLPADKSDAVLIWSEEES